jgi:hypothetical protein
MYRAELSVSSHLLWQHMGFLKAVLDKLKRFFQDGILALDRVNLAAAEGKALDELRERLLGSYIEAEISLEDIPSSLSDGKREVHVRVETSKPLSPEVQFHIYQMLVAVFLRYKINIRTDFLSGHRQRGGQ